MSSDIERLRNRAEEARDALERADSEVARASLALANAPEGSPVADLLELRRASENAATAATEARKRWGTASTELTAAENSASPQWMGRGPSAEAQAALVRLYAVLNRRLCLIDQADAAFAEAAHIFNYQYAPNAGETWKLPFSPPDPKKPSSLDEAHRALLAMRGHRVLSGFKTQFQEPIEDVTERVQRQADVDIARDLAESKRQPQTRLTEEQREQFAFILDHSGGWLAVAHELGVNVQLSAAQLMSIRDYGRCFDVDMDAVVKGIPAALKKATVRAHGGTEQMRAIAADHVAQGYPPLSMKVGGS